MLYPILKDRHVPTQCKVIIFNSILKPILTYGSESWSLTSKTKSRIQASEMKVLRLIRGVTRLDRMQNIKIREDLKTTAVLESQEKTKMRWYGHVNRMDEQRPAKIYMKWKPHGTRPVGRPRKRWMDGVKDAAENRGATVEEIEVLCQDREEWRKFIETGD